MLSKKEKFLVKEYAKKLIGKRKLNEAIKVFSDRQRHKAEIKLGQRYYDKRFGDYYTIEKMTPNSSHGEGVDVSMKYDKGKTRIDSGYAILSYIDAKQHSLDISENKLNEAKMSDEVRELTLFAENDSKLYDVLMRNYLKPLLAKLKQGKYDGNLAIKLLEYYYQQYVRPEYKRLFGDVKLDPSERREFGAYFVDVLQETDEFLVQVEINDSKNIPYKLL